MRKGDKVKILEDWRDWKKGEIAIIEKYIARKTPMYDDSYILNPTNGSTKDFHTLPGYLIERYYDIEDVANFAINKWGREVQVNKIQEEALELSLVLNQLKCPTKDKEQLEKDLYGELADMKIMMAQAEILFDKDKINEMVRSKIDRFSKKYINL